MHVKTSAAYLRSSDVALILGVTRRTLQLWVREGRVPEPVRSDSGYYLWTSADLANVRSLPSRKRGRRPRSAALEGRDAA